MSAYTARTKNSKWRAVLNRDLTWTLFGMPKDTEEVLARRIARLTEIALSDYAGPSLGGKRAFVFTRVMMKMSRTFRLDSDWITAEKDRSEAGVTY